MAFTAISAGGLTFNPTRPGVYRSVLVGMGQPADEIRISGPSKASKSVKSISVTRVVEKDVVIAGVTKRVNAVLSQTFTYPSDGTFSAQELHNMEAQLGQFIDNASLTRIDAGEI